MNLTIAKQVDNHFQEREINRIKANNSHSHAIRKKKNQFTVWMEEHPMDLFIWLFVRPLSWETSNKNIGKFNLAYLILPFHFLFLSLSLSLCLLSVCSQYSVKIFSLSNWFSFYLWFERLLSASKVLFNEILWKCSFFFILSVKRRKLTLL